MQWTITVEIKLTNTKALAEGELSNLKAGESGQCTANTTKEGEILTLISKLLDSSKDRLFLMQVDKTSLGSASGGQKGHRFSLHWHTPPNREVDLSFDTPTVTREFISLDGKIRTFKFTGGTVRVSDRSGVGRVKDSTSLFCDNKDDILVTVTILP